MTSAFSGYAWVALGGALGAMARMGMGRWVRSFAGGAFPWHTFTINVLGSFLLGFLATAIAIRTTTHTAAFNHFAAIGFLGAFTTFSTWMLDSHRLADAGHAHLVWLNLGLSLAAGFAAVVSVRGRLRSCGRSPRASRRTR